MTMPTEPLISDSSVDMIPCFCLTIAIGAPKGRIWVLAERDYGLAHALVVECVAWRDRCGERMIDGGSTTRHHRVWLQVSPNVFVSHGARCAT